MHFSNADKMTYLQNSGYLALVKITQLLESYDKMFDYFPVGSIEQIRSDILDTIEIYLVSILDKIKEEK